MSITATQLREQRLQRLIDDCQKQVLSQIIGPFGLSIAMFEDKTGGNVTTAYNFEKGVVATEGDQALYDRFQVTSQNYDRESYNLPQHEWSQKRTERIEAGIDGYTGKKIDLNADLDLDHVVPVKQVTTRSDAHLALGKIEGDTVSIDGIREVVNADANLELTNSGLNRSKKDEDLREWMNKPKAGFVEKTNAEHYGIDKECARTAYERANTAIDSTINKELLDKYRTELLDTGAQQAARMGIRQAMGVLLTELVNGLFNEFKVLFKKGVAPDKTLFREITERLMRVIEGVKSKFPDALSQALQGGVSGFMSNLLTFLINNFVTTAKRYVRMFREGLLGLIRAFKMMLFPQKGMSSEQAMREGLKVLSAVVVTSAGILLEESVSAFIVTVPFLKPIADLVSPALIGIMVGLVSAFLAYQIDRWFDRRHFSNEERYLNELLVDANRREQFAGELEKLSENALVSVEHYAQSKELYEGIAKALHSAAEAGWETLQSLQATVIETANQVTKSREMIAYVNASQSEIEEFLSKE